MLRFQKAVMVRQSGLFLLAMLLGGTQIHAQSASSAPALPVVDHDSILRQEGYLRPPAPIERVVTAPRHLNVSLRNVNPDYRFFVRTESQGMSRLEDFSRPYHNLAGFQVDPVAKRSRGLTTGTGVGITLIAARDGREIPIQVPEGVKVSSVRWSPDGSRLAFLAHSPTETHIRYVANPENGRSTQLTRTPLLASHITTFRWASDNEHVVAVLQPADNPNPPMEPATPTTPLVRVAGPRPNRVRTYFSLLESPWEMDLLEYFSTGQLALINVRTGRVTPVGEPAMIRSLNPDPDGQFFRVTTLDRPFSYVVQVGRFPSKEELWDRDGKALATLSERGLRDGSVPPPDPDTTDVDDDDRVARADTLKRSLGWRPDAPGITYIQRIPPDQREQAQDDEDSDNNRIPDRIIHWLPPFDSTDIQVVYTHDGPIGNVRYSDDGSILFLTEGSGNRTHVFAVFLDAPDTTHTIMRGTSQSLSTTSGSRGQTVVRLSPDGSSVYLTGTTRDLPEGHEPVDEEEDERPPLRQYLDKLEIRTGETTRLYHGEAEPYERLSAILNDEISEVMLVRERPTVPANFYYKDLRTGEERRLTDNVDHTPELQGMETRTYLATRPDGVDIRVRIRLPVDYREGMRYPAMFWFYPREYTSTAAYSRTIRGTTIGPSTSTSTRFRSPPGAGSIRLLTLMGYIIVEPDCPIIGPEGRMNDNYTQDLRDNMLAVIDELDQRGYIDRHRLGIGGHSYGGFGTMNVMAHTPFFKAGIAGASNTNRTFTPNGFQRERRDLWSAREVYMQMSPFMYANQITGALLMYHGQVDQNVGTHPNNSERMYHAMMGMGKDVALYMYPHEDHGQRTLETRLDMWARWIAWLDKYVKNADSPWTTTVVDSDNNGDRDRQH